jgi:hypothetical protein
VGGDAVAERGLVGVAGLMYEDLEQGDEVPRECHIVQNGSKGPDSYALIGLFEDMTLVPTGEGEEIAEGQI